MPSESSQPDELYAGDHLPGQKTLIDLQEPDETKPIFDKRHDIVGFTAKDSARYALACVSYSAERKRLAATNGRAMITVPVEQDGLPDMLIEGEAFHKAIVDGGADGVQCDVADGKVLLGVPELVTRRAIYGEGKFPNVYSFPELRKRWAPEVTLALSPKELELIVKYAKRVKAEGIYFGFAVSATDGHVKTRVDSGVRFTFESSDEVVADVVGIVMPRVDGETYTASEEEGAPAKAWRVRHVSHLGLPDKLAQKVADAGYDTLGKLRDLMDKQPTGWRKKIKGVGEETAATIADAFAAFWSNHPEYDAAA